MAEAVVVVGAIAAFSQLARYGAALAGVLLDYSSEVRAIPATLEDLIEHLEWHRRIVQSINLKTLNSATAPSIQNLVSRSLRSTLELQQLLAPLVNSEAHSRYDKLCRVFSYKKRTRKIAKYRAELESCERRLILHFSATSYHNTKPGVEQSVATPTTPRRTPTTPSILVGLPPRSTFIGGDATLCSVSRALTRPGNKACLVGIEGVGKSEAAKECAYRLHQQQSDISFFWIQACHRAALQQSYEHILQKTGMLEVCNTQEITFLDIVQTLDTIWSGQWVLIVDNVHPETDQVSALRHVASVPIRNGSILFTTRNTQTATLLADDRFIFSINPLCVQEANRLLQFHLRPGRPPEEDFTPLLKYLEYLPSAIIRGAEIMRVYKLTAVQYLDLLRQHEEHAPRLFILNHPNSPAAIGLQDDDWFSHISMVNLYEQDANAAQLLAVLSCFSDARIPSASFGRSYYSTDFINAISVLKVSHLIMTDEVHDSIRIPRIVRLGVRSFLRRHGIFSSYALRCLQLISQCFPECERQFSMLGQCRLYLPHAMGILKEYAPEWNTAKQFSSHGADSTHCGWLSLTSFESNEDEQTTHFRPRVITSQEGSSWDYVGPLALRISHFLRILGQYKIATQFAGLALRWLCDADHLQPSCEETFLCKSAIATLSHYLGHPLVFASQTEHLLRSQTALLKSHRPLTIRALRNKALALQAQGHHDQAEGYHRRAITICTTIYGQRDQELLDEKHGLALSILGQQGRAEEALSIFCVVYNAMEEALGVSNPKTLSVLANIGCALQCLYRWTDAYEVMSRALSGRKSVLGEDHPRTLQCRANLAQIYVANGDMAGAVKITKETLRLHVAKLGEDHHLSLHILNNLGYLFSEQELFVEAADTLHRVATKRAVVLGPQHRDTLASMFYASEAYWKLGMFDQALDLGLKVLDGRRGLDEDDASLREIEERLAEIENDRWLDLVGRTASAL